MPMPYTLEPFVAVSSGGSHMYTTNESSSSSFTLGLLAGAALGAGLAILYAPRAGSEVRGQLRQMGHDAMASLGDVGRSLRDTGERLAERGKEAAAQAVKEGERAFDRATNDVNRRTGASM
jgi:gas vesicle protein